MSHVTGTSLLHRPSQLLLLTIDEIIKGYNGSHVQMCCSHAVLRLDASVFSWRGVVTWSVWRAPVCCWTKFKQWEVVYCIDELKSIKTL